MIIDILFYIYGCEIRSTQAKKAYKHKQLRENPEALTADICHTGGISNLLLYTDSFSSVQEDFNTIRALAETEKQRQEKISSEEKSTIIPTEQPPGEELEEDQPLGDRPGHISQLDSRVSQMRESLSLQEVELVELKELLLSKQTSTESTQQQPGEE